MQNYIVRVYRAHPGDAGSVSGILEDVESGRKATFHNLDELQAMLADSVMSGQIGFSNLVPDELDTHEDVAVIG
jgi:hypothetical protein